MSHDIHRYELSQSTHRLIFDRQIIPQRLAPAPHQENPVAVYLLAQPGAGKSTTAQVLRHSLDKRGGAVHFCNDHFRPYHPEYLRLLAEEPEMAGTYVSKDYRAWRALGEEYVRSHRIDALIEMAPSDPERFLESVEPFHSSGYHVEVALLSVPGEMSRIGLADRYLRDRLATGSGRFPSRHGHDVSYNAIPAIADVIDAGQSVDVVSVMRRGQELVYQNKRARDGTWAHPPRTSQAIHSERDRSWSSRETHQFGLALARLTARPDLLNDNGRDELANLTASFSTRQSVRGAATAALFLPRPASMTLSTEVSSEAAAAPARPGPDRPSGLAL